MSLTSGEMTPADIAAVTGNGNGFNGDGAWWLIVLFLFAMGNNGWGIGNNVGGAVPYVGATAEMQRGFDQASLTAQLAGLNSAVTSGFANAATAQCGQTAALQNAITANQIATMQGFSGAQNQLCNCCHDMSNALNSGVNLLQSTMMQNEMARQNCCCETKQAIADLKYTVATENCADRAEIANGIRDIITNQTANTQMIIDKMCQQEIDALKANNVALQNQLNMANLAASQTAQTAQIISELKPAAAA